MEVAIARLLFDVENKLELNDAQKLRGYLGRLFWDNPIAHGHKKDGQLIYRYPCVQYKVIDERYVVIGFNEGGEILRATFNNLKALNIDGNWQAILAQALEQYKATFSVFETPLVYTFLTPWLALNEQNYHRYLKSGPLEKRVLLERILVANIISMSKGLGYTVPEPVKANIINTKGVPASLKGTPMLGFLGTFSVNFAIPDYWGIGKSVSRGFGTVKAVDSASEASNSAGKCKARRHQES